MHDTSVDTASTSYKSHFDESLDNAIVYKSSSGDEIPERDVTYIILSVYLLTTEL